MMKRKKVTFKKLLYHHCPYTDAEQFEIFRWMIKTGWDYRYRGRWGDFGVFEWLYGLSSTGSQPYWYTYGFSSIRTWRSELKLIFLRAVVDDDCPETVAKWRVQERIGSTTSRILTLDVDDKIDCNQNMFELFTNNKKLTTQLNPSWKEAVEIDNVILSTNGETWRVILTYGFDHSSWGEVLCADTNISMVLKGAADKLTELTT